MKDALEVPRHAEAALKNGRHGAGDEIVRKHHQRVGSGVGGEKLRHGGTGAFTNRREGGPGGRNARVCVADARLVYLNAELSHGEAKHGAPCAVGVLAWDVGGSFWPVGGFGDLRANVRREGRATRAYALEGCGNPIVDDDVRRVGDVAQRGIAQERDGRAQRANGVVAVAINRTEEERRDARFADCFCENRTRVGLCGVDRTHPGVDAARGEGVAEERRHVRVVWEAARVVVKQNADPSRRRRWRHRFRHYRSAPRDAHKKAIGRKAGQRLLRAALRHAELAANLGVRRQPRPRKPRRAAKPCPPSRRDLHPFRFLTRHHRHSSTCLKVEKLKGYQ